MREGNLGGQPSALDDITASPDGSIWISKFDADRVLHIRPSEARS